MIQTDLPNETSLTITTQQHGDEGTKWYKIGEINMANKSLSDRYITFLIISGFKELLVNVPEIGILKIHLRTNDQSKIEYNLIQWLVTTYTKLENFCLEVKDQNLVEFWVGVPQYESYHFRVLGEGDRLHPAKQWTLYTDPGAAEKPTQEQGYTEYKSTVAKLTASS